ncbi:hypothetical protein [Streptomyces sp. NL15-2K]|uniref:hypothetical protein n=1 Tax=Streptomyces sp. NL15-2K TaxID=376149 RepID=UPI00209C4FA2|nr:MULTISPECIES: hypothetical protein [Actinomycetes]WKX11920.1 hypothetical protein Q4V64_32175 [Kutzneria buriramensis]
MGGLMATRRRRARARLAIFVPVSMAGALLGMPAAHAAAHAAVDAVAQGQEQAQEQEQEPDRDPDVPDLAVVVAGGSGRTTAVRSGEPYFARLWQLLQPTFTGSEPVSEAWAEGGYPPVRMTVVWGLTGVGGWPQTNSAPGGDVAMERQDQLFVAEDGTPWVRVDWSPDVTDDDIRWHRAPRSVWEQLSRMELLGTAGDGAVDGTVGSGTVGSTAGEGAGRWRPDGAWWAVPGLAVGFGAGAGGTLLIRRAAARPGAGPPREEPRQELIDL